MFFKHKASMANGISLVGPCHLANFAAIKKTHKEQQLVIQAGYWSREEKRKEKRNKKLE